MTQYVRISTYDNNKKIYQNNFTTFPILIGRDIKCQVNFVYNFLSRKHATIVYEDMKFYLIDLKSRNGTWVNGKRIEKIEIPDQMDFFIDRLRFVIELFEKTKDEVEDLPQKFEEKQTYISALSITKKSQFDHQKKSSVRDSRDKALLNNNFLPDLTELHPSISNAQYKRIEAIVMWHDQIYEVFEFEPHEKIRIGQSIFADIQLPLKIKPWRLAKVSFSETKLQLPQDIDFKLKREGKEFSSEQLIQLNAVSPSKDGFGLTMKLKDVVEVILENGLKIVLRYVPATKKLIRHKLIEPDIAIKTALIGSTFLHVLIAALIIRSVPAPKPAPIIKDVPERFARLLVEPEKPKPTPPPVQPTPPPIAEKEKPPEIKPEIKPVKEKKVVEKIYKTPKQITKQNKYPIIVKRENKKVPQAFVQVPKEGVASNVKGPVKVENVGALAILSTLGPPSDNPIPQDIQINKNAGGAPSKVASLKGVPDVLSSSQGKLLGMGSGNVSTKGKGSLGPGSGYGVAGLKGTAGSRVVEGAVVGQPKLVSLGDAKKGTPEGLTRAQVMSVVTKHAAEIQHCYEKALLSNPDVAGRMEFEWDIQANGSVSASRIRKSTVNNGDNLGECVKNVFMGMKFPIAKNGMSTTPTIGFPFGRL